MNNDEEMILVGEMFLEFGNLTTRCLQSLKNKINGGIEEKIDMFEEKHKIISNYLEKCKKNNLSENKFLDYCQSIDPDNKTIYPSAIFTSRQDEEKKW